MSFFLQPGSLVFPGFFSLHFFVTSLAGLFTFLYDTVLQVLNGSFQSSNFMEGAWGSGSRCESK